MRTERLRVSARYHNGATIACPTGVLDRVTYPTMRDTLLKYAAEEPDALIVELNHLDLPTASALSVFSLVALRVADWPAVPVLLVATDEHRRTALTASTIRRFVPIYDSVSDAIADMADPPSRSRAVIELPPSPISTRRARHFVRTTCDRWHVTELAVDAQTVVTAFVENTLEYTDSTAFVRLELRCGLLTIAVSDDSPRPAVLHERTEGGVSPSGLLLVAGVAAVWGCTPTMTGGKTVWAVLKRSWYSTANGHTGE